MHISHIGSMRLGLNLNNDPLQLPFLFNINYPEKKTTADQASKELANCQKPHDNLNS